MYREKPNNVTDLIYRSSGKYIIALEGDDFWTDKNKIQTQIEFLENNDDYSEYSIWRWMVILCVFNNEG